MADVHQLVRQSFIAADRFGIRITGPMTTSDRENQETSGRQQRCTKKKADGKALDMNQMQNNGRGIMRDR
jgi:hypothetical protein